MAYHPKWMTKLSYDANEDNLVDDADKVDGADAGVAANNVFKIPSGIAQGDIFYVDGSGNVVRLAAGTSGQYLRTQGAGANPVWASAPGGWNVISKNTNYTASDGDCVLVDASSGNITITLPEPSKDIQVNVKKIDSSANVVTVVPNGGSIDGESSKEISTQYESYFFISDGTNWYII